MTAVEANKEKLKGELDHCLQLCQLRAERTEMGIYNMRAVELVQHQACVDQHCRGILKVLGDWRTELKELQIQQIKLTEYFQQQIYNTEEDFSFATKSKKIIKHCTSLQMTLDKHLSIVQALQRDFRQKTEFKMESLKEANAQIIIFFKLFSEGGDCSPQEIEVIHSHLEKVDKTIESVESAIIQDMNRRESKCLDEAKDILRQFEDKYRFISIDLKFLEKIEKIFTNTCILIKGEVMKSNMQKRKIDSKLSDLQEIMAEYDKPCHDKNVVTEAEIISLTNSLMEELSMRCQNLECFFDASTAVPSLQAPLQGAFAAATRLRSYKQDKTCSPDRDSLLQPSSIGVSFLNDVAVGVIKSLHKSAAGKPYDFEEVNTDSKDRHSAALTVSAKLNSSDGLGQRLGKRPSQSQMEILLRKPVESISGHSFPFKATVTSILWKANNILLLVAEEFYKRNEGRAISCPQQVPETFEQCVEEINKRLLTYKSQSFDHHNSCLQEFRLQLKEIEEFISSIPEKLLYKLRDRYLMDLRESLTDIQQHYKPVQHQREAEMVELRSKMKVYLSKAACESELKQLVVAEEMRRIQQHQAIQNVRQEVQACVCKNAQEFVTALASLAEVLLLQLDKLITIHEVQVGHAKLKRVNINTLIHQKQAGYLHEDRYNPVQKSSRTWSGICYFGSTQKQQTAAITTAKFTLSHLRTIEVRDALHEHYGQMVQKELERVDKQYEAQKIQMQQWYDHWQSQLNTINTH